MAREQWESQIGFVLAAVGSAIGLGNIWRFSYMAYKHGGGAFLIPYIIALLSVGIPLLILEFAIGHERIGSAPLAFRKIDKNWEWLGWWSVSFVMFGIVLYYITIISWCLNYFIKSLSLAWGNDPNSYFFTQFLAVRGLELANKIFMPLLLVLTTILVFWSLTLDGAGVGIKAYLKPDFTMLANPKIWIDAFSQIFFTLSLGFGIMIAYASYLPEKANLTRGAYVTALINCGYSLFAGVAVFSVLGFMAVSQGQEISEVVSESIGLAFVAYPKALSIMPGGNIFGAVFFLCLVVAGISSSISIVESFTSAVVDKFGISRKKFVTVLCILGFIGSIIFTTNAGLFWLDIVDHFLTHYGLLIVAIAECVLVGWLFNIKMIRRHINRISSIKVGAGWEFFIKVFAPAVLLALLSIDFYNELSKPYGGYSWTAVVLIGIVWLLTNLVIAFILATRPWKTENHKAKGRGEIQE
ncbi:MAG: sodium-dependent transporter [Deltaproteobacteria bacterium]|nr:sodium-dependent transporter [Deltaproteobacteria bacterium]